MGVGLSVLNKVRGGSLYVIKERQLPHLMFFIPSQRPPLLKVCNFIHLLPLPPNVRVHSAINPLLVCISRLILGFHRIPSHPSINLPILLGKGSDGNFPIWSLIIYSPYLYFVRAFSFIRGFTSGEPPYSKIDEGLYVGGWPYAPDKLPPGNPAIVDCTCELPRKREVTGSAYLCVPTWDTRSPDPGEIERAVKWACGKRAQGVPVFVHFAYGHGRSVAVMCALLVALGLAEDWKTAEKIIKEKRPYIRMNSLHRKALEEWSKDRLSTPKR